MGCITVVDLFSLNWGHHVLRGLLILFVGALGFVFVSDALLMMIFI